MHSSCISTSNVLIAFRNDLSCISNPSSASPGVAPLHATIERHAATLALMAFCDQNIGRFVSLICMVCSLSLRCVAAFFAPSNARLALVSSYRSERRRLFTLLSPSRAALAPSGWGHTRRECLHFSVGWLTSHSVIWHCGYPGSASKTLFRCPR